MQQSVFLFTRPGTLNKWLKTVGQERGVGMAERRVGKAKARIVEYILQSWRGSHRSSNAGVLAVGIAALFPPYYHWALRDDPHPLSRHRRGGLSRGEGARVKTTTIKKRGCATSESELRLEGLPQGKAVTPLIASFQDKQTR